MTRQVTLRDANQNFAKYVRAVEAGREFIITRRGQPVAQLVPVRRGRVLTPAQEAARQRVRKRLERGWNLGIKKFNREEIYEGRG